MAKSLLDQLREHLEDVEHTFLYFLTIMFFFAVVGALTLVGIYFYTQR